MALVRGFQNTPLFPATHAFFHVIYDLNVQIRELPIEVFLRDLLGFDVFETNVYPMHFISHESDLVGQILLHVIDLIRKLLVAPLDRLKDLLFFIRFHMPSI